MYRFRRVICPNCEHQFTHQEHSLYSGSAWYEYIDKETDQLLDFAICPKCSFDMVLYESSSTGMDPCDDRIRRYAVRGI